MIGLLIFTAGVQLKAFGNSKCDFHLLMKSGCRWAALFLVFREVSEGTRDNLGLLLSTCSVHCGSNCHSLLAPLNDPAKKLLSLLSR